MSSRQFAMRYLKAVEKKNQQYFDQHKLNIKDCVAILGSDKRVSVHLLNKSLPVEIKREIEAMFW